jgi:uncharacterized membrane protein
MRALAAGILAGVAAGWAARGPTLMPWPKPARRAFVPTVAVGVGLASAVAAEMGLRSAAVATGRRRLGSLATPVAVTASVAGGAWLAARNRKRALGSFFDRARALGPGFQSPPTSVLTTGGPGSVVDWSTVGREGARFLGVGPRAADIRAVMQAEPLADPIRVYVGYDSAATIDERVHLAILELRRTGAFDRSTLLVHATAGTGYANPAPVNTLEILSRGDCATVAVSYGLLPSFLSLDRVPIGQQTQQALLTAIAKEQPRARIVLYGESLGARVQQAALPGGVDDLKHLGVHRALWVGTPRSGVELWPDAVVLDSPADIPASNDAIVWLLEHDADPVILLRWDLLWRRPEWLRGKRGRGIPHDMRWRPVVTSAQLMMDVIYATDLKPGEFQSSGHDYRADLGAITAAAFDLPTDPGIAERLETHLRRLERARAARIDGDLSAGL